jgi:hypothetical protein
MKINILKTTLATTALFTAISCLVQAPARAWEGDYEPNDKEQKYLPIPSVLAKQVM